MNLLNHSSIQLKSLSTSFLADTETPLSIYFKIAQNKFGSYLFESVVGGNRWSRFSIIGIGAEHWLTVLNNTLEYWINHQKISSQTVENPLDEIKKISQKIKVNIDPELVQFSGGLVGYFGYETIQYIERKLSNNQPKSDTINVPDCVLILSVDLIVFDNLNGKLHLISHYEQGNSISQKKAQDKLEQWQVLLKETKLEVSSLLGNTKSPYKFDSKSIHFEFPEKEFKKSVASIKNYILEGDAMQVVLSQRMSIPFNNIPIDLYRAVRHINPSPYMYFMDYLDYQIVGSSPEILVRMENSTVTVRPIAGTRPRGENPQQDLQLKEDLLNDSKEISEHLMLIDLGRNDVGRISNIGTIEVTEQMIVEYYSHVMHIVSNVEGKIDKNIHPIDVLKATFPAGTVSGAPKIRAMKIINELEPSKRGIYSGAVGYIGWNNNMDTAIAIRTAVIKDNLLHIQAGAGIVADSMPNNEWQETLNKAKALLNAYEFVKTKMK